MPTDGFNLSALTEDINERAFGIDFWHQALLTNNTMAFAAQYGEVKPNLKQDTYKMPLMEVPVSLQAAGCGAEPTVTANITQRELKMIGMQAAGQFCPKELEPYFLADFIPAGQTYTDFNPLQSAIVGRIQEEIAKKMALFPWYGPTGGDTVTYTTSWIDQLNDASNIWVGGSAPNNGGANGTDANGAFNIGQALINKFLANEDTAGDVFIDGAIAIAIPPSAANLYFQNYRTLYGDHTFNPEYQNLANGVALGGWYHPGTRVRFTIVNALGRGGEFVAFRKGNLVLGADLLSDTNKMALWYDINTNLIKWRMEAKLGTGIRSITNANLPATVAPNIVYWSATS